MESSWYVALPHFSPLVLHGKCMNNTLWIEKTGAAQQNLYPMHALPMQLTLPTHVYYMPIVYISRISIATQSAWSVSLAPAIFFSSMHSCYSHSSYLQCNNHQ